MSMRLRGKPDWICSQEEEQQRENARRIERQLTGRKCPSMESVIRKMRHDYARYGKTKKTGST